MSFTLAIPAHMLAYILAHYGTLIVHARQLL